MSAVLTIPILYNVNNPQNSCFGIIVVNADKKDVYKRFPRTAGRGVTDIEGIRYLRELQKQTTLYTIAKYLRRNREGKQVKVSIWLKWYYICQNQESILKRYKEYPNFYSVNALQPHNRHYFKLWGPHVPSTIELNLKLRERLPDLLIVSILGVLLGWSTKEVTTILLL